MTAIQTIESCEMQQTYFPNRATWLWRTDIITAEAPQIDHFISFAAQHRVGRLYIHINPDISSTDFGRFVARCTEAGIMAEALMGDPGWVVNPNHDSLETRLRWIEEYQGGCGRDERMQIQGLHVDIEVCRGPNADNNVSDGPDH